MVAFAVVLAGHLLALYWPRVDVPESVPGGSDKVAHVLLFALPVLAGAVAVRRSWLVVSALAVHAPVSEWLQATVLPHRRGDLSDAIADLVGVVVGVVAAAGLRRRGRRALVD